MKNDLCLCGHVRAHHFIATDVHWDSSEADRCISCPLNLLSAWHTYKRDNLQYLKQIFDAKKI